MTVYLLCLEVLIDGSSSDVDERIDLLSVLPIVSSLDSVCIGIHI
jgi:hypothetical protein